MAEEEKKLNILFLTSWYPNRLFPSLGNFVEKHAECVALKSNVAVLFVCSDDSCEKKFALDARMVNNIYSVKVYYKKVKYRFPIVTHYQRLKRYFKAHLIGLDLIEKNFGKVDLVHQNVLYPSGIVADYLKIKRNIPYIVTEHSTKYSPSKNIKLNWVEKILSKTIAKNASCIAPVSANLRDAMIERGLNGNYEIVYNVVDTKLFHPIKNKIKNRKIKLLHISTLDDAHKNISGMLRVTAELSKLRTDFEFLFIGEGDRTGHIKTAIQLGIYNTFAFFDGVKITAEIAEIMRNADCFVMFSNYENLPVVIIEAFASGIPVVSTNVGGIPEHIKENFGILINPLDEKGLLNSLNEMLDNIKEGKYNSEELSNYAIENFSYEKVSEHFHTIYYRVLNEKINE